MRELYRDYTAAARDFGDVHDADAVRAVEYDTWYEIFCRVFKGELPSALFDPDFDPGVPCAAVKNEAEQDLGKMKL